jgi:hypothetical protein
LIKTPSAARRAKAAKDRFIIAKRRRIVRASCLTVKSRYGLPRIFGRSGKLLNESMGPQFQQDIPAARALYINIHIVMAKPGAPGQSRRESALTFVG